MFHDLRHALRAFIRMPGFSVTAIVTLALGIGANTAIFSVVYALLLKPLPFREPERMIYVHDTYPGIAFPSVSWQTFVALRDGNRTLASLTAVALATVGIYSLVSYSVAQRTREIGIRVALGANAASVLRMIIGEGMTLALVGLALGLAGTWALTASLKTLLYEVSPADPLVLVATSGAVLLVTAAACFIPARRMMRVDPTVALRAE
jgi:hypothetical protein